MSGRDKVSHDNVSIIIKRDCYIMPIDILLGRMFHLQTQILLLSSELTWLLEKKSLVIRKVDELTENVLLQFLKTF